MTELTIGIIEAGEMPGNVAEIYGQYTDIYRTLLSDRLPQARYKTYRAYQNRLPQDSAECDAWLVSGSPNSAFENQDWILALQAFLAEAHEARIPLVGICFGHQILAQALGGKVERSAKGWVVGLDEYDIVQSRPWQTGERPGFAIYAYHQDQVSEVPKNCEVLASSIKCPNATLAYGETAISLQGHPEFSAGLMRRLISLRRGQGLPEALADQALLELPPSDAPFDQARMPESQRIASWIGNFLTRNIRAQGI